MAKPGIPKVQDEALLRAADLILQRAGEVKVPAAKDRALELARLVLVGNADFGGREMRDQQIVKVLEAEQIGLATFRKALSTARKELIKKPKATTRAKSAKSQGDVGDVGSIAPPKPARAENGAIAATVARRLL